MGDVSVRARSRVPESAGFPLRPLAGGETVNLCEAYRGKVVLVVNTASRCAFTPQYEGLEALYDKYRSRGVVVLGFPANDFGAQKPGTEKQIEDFCRLASGVRFPMFEKTHASQERADPYTASSGKWRANTLSGVSTSISRIQKESWWAVFAVPCVQRTRDSPRQSSHGYDQRNEAGSVLSGRPRAGDVLRPCGHVSVGSD